jgi:hypothetical protein
MKKLSKEHWADITKAMEACNEEASEMQGQIEKYNLMLDEAKGPVEQAINAYNEKIADLRSIYTAIAADAASYHDERGEKWQESDAGTSYQEWIDQLEEPEGLEEVDVDFPEEIEMPEIPDFDDTSWLPPEEPGT